MKSFSRYCCSTSFFNIKKLCFAVAIFSVFYACEDEFYYIDPLEAERINKIEINGKQVSVTVVYITPTPCWYYHRTETENNDVVFTAKVFGKDDGDGCIDVIDSIQHEEKISFLTPGEKTLKFWQNDTTYLDTTIVVH